MKKPKIQFFQKIRETESDLNDGLIHNINGKEQKVFVVEHGLWNKPKR